MRALPFCAMSLAMLLQACSNTTVSVEPDSAPIIPATLDKPETIQPQSFMLRGEVVVAMKCDALRRVAAISNTGSISHQSN